jgi:thiol-disulfide isomerase/thioredoxin
MKADAAAVIALALTLSGCGSTDAPPASEGRQPYRGWVTTRAGDDIPFLFELPANCNVERAALLNGPERLSLPCQRLGARVLLDFVVYGTRISADIDNDGALNGHWSHTGGQFRSDDRVRFSAQPLAHLDPALRFPPPDGDGQASGQGGDVSGIWRLEFASRESAKAVLQTEGNGIVRGTAEVPFEYGDLRYLAGNVHGSSLSLSTFDGSSAYLIHGRLEGNGRMTGALIRADGSRDAFTAFRSADFDVVDPLQRVRVTSFERRLDLAPLLSPRYAGKAVIVELFGTWCSNCNDLAPLLAELDKKYRAAGLEVLSFAFELSADEGFVRERVAEYKAAHGVEWDVITPTATLQELLAVGPAQLSSISGVPVTLFFNRDRTVRAIYTGFSGPATGASHQRAAATFRRLTNEILDSR